MYLKRKETNQSFEKSDSPTTKKEIVRVIQVDI